MFDICPLTFVIYHLRMSRRYITTAIDYPNAAPHMGHVLEKVLADVLARWFRLRGDDVRFQIGTDEHGVKIQQTAQKQQMTPKELVDRNVPLFQDLYGRLHISFDSFIRTSDQAAHWPTVTALWNKLKAAGVLEKRSYKGLYCSGCERFLTKRDLVDGVCPIHKKAPEEVAEENWFFLLSKDTDDLRRLLTDQWDGDAYRIIPSSRAGETLALLDQGLEDISFSRPRSSLSWGIPVPDDPDQVMYVWCDALTNYISGLGFFTDHEDRSFWDDAEVTHVIGKDIARFHALYWPSMLKHAGVRAPDKLLIHGFLTSEGEKMSKSLGNVVVPEEVMEKFGVDPLRYYVSREVPVGRDGDFSWQRMQDVYDSELRNNIGNLLNRVVLLLKKNGGAIVSSKDPGLLNDLWVVHEKAMDSFKIENGILTALSLATACNTWITQEKPWELQGEEKLQKLSALAEALRHVSLMLLPFIPDTAYRISTQLNVPYAEEMLSKDFVITDALKQWGGCEGWKAVGEAEILFAPLNP